MDNGVGINKVNKKVFYYFIRFSIINEKMIIRKKLIKIGKN